MQNEWSNHPQKYRASMHHALILHPRRGAWSMDARYFCERSCQSFSAKPGSLNAHERVVFYFPIGNIVLWVRFRAIIFCMHVCTCFLEVARPGLVHQYRVYRRPWSGALHRGSALSSHPTRKGVGMRSNEGRSRTHQQR